MLGGVDGSLVRSGKGDRELPTGLYRRLGISSEVAAFDEVFNEDEVDDWVKRTTLDPKKLQKRLHRWRD